MDKYAKLEENAPPQYSEKAEISTIFEEPPRYLPGAPTIQGLPGTQAVSAQPQIVYVRAPEVIPENETPDHLIVSILVTIYCCLPFGIAGMLKASDCRNARMRGDRENALLLGREAKKYAMIGLGFGFTCIIISLSLYSVAMAHLAKDITS